jgi:hypothetical protein
MMLIPVEIWESGRQMSAAEALVKTARLGLPTKNDSSFGHNIGSRKLN